MRDYFVKTATAFTLIGLMSSVSARAISIDTASSYSSNTAANVLVKVPSADVALFKQPTTQKAKPSHTFTQGHTTPGAFFAGIKETLEAKKHVNAAEDMLQKRAAQRATQETALNTKIGRASTDEAYYEAQIELYTLKLQWANEDGDRVAVADLTKKLEESLYSSKTTKLNNRLRNLDWRSIAYKELAIELYQTYADYYAANGDTYNSNHYSTQTRNLKVELAEARRHEAGVQANIALSAQIDTLRRQQTARTRGTIEWLEYEVQIQRLTARCHTNLNEDYNATTAETAATRCEEQIGQLRRAEEERRQREERRAERLRLGGAGAAALQRYKDGDEAAKPAAYAYILGLLQDMPAANKQQHTDMAETLMRASKYTPRTAAETRAVNELLWGEFAKKSSTLEILNPDATAGEAPQTLDLYKLLMQKHLVALPIPTQAEIDYVWGDMAANLVTVAVNLEANGVIFGARNAVDELQVHLDDEDADIEVAIGFNSFKDKLMQFDAQRDLYKQRLVAVYRFLNSLDLANAANQAIAKQILMAMLENSTRCKDRALNGLELAETIARTGANPDLHTALHGVLMLWKKDMLQALSTQANGSTEGEFVERLLFNMHGLTNLGLDFGLHADSQMHYVGCGATKSLATILPEFLDAVSLENLLMYLQDNPMLAAFLEGNAEYEAFKEANGEERNRFQELLTALEDALDKVNNDNDLEAADTEALADLAATPQFAAIKRTKEAKLAAAQARFNAAQEAEARAELAVLAVIENPIAANIDALPENWYYDIFMAAKGLYAIEFADELKVFDRITKGKFIKNLIIGVYGIQQGKTTMPKALFEEMASIATDLETDYPTNEAQLEAAQQRRAELEADFDARIEALRHPAHDHVDDLRALQNLEARVAELARDEAYLREGLVFADVDLARHDEYQDLLAAYTAANAELTPQLPHLAVLRAGNPVDLQGQLNALHAERAAALRQVDEQIAHLNTLIHPYDHHAWWR